MLYTPINITIYDNNGYNINTTTIIIFDIVNNRTSNIIIINDNKEKKAKIKISVKGETAESCRHTLLSVLSY